MPTRIEWRDTAVAALERLDASVRLRVERALSQLERLDDPEQRLVPYTGDLRGFWKLRVGDYRLVCILKHRPTTAVIVVFLAHRRHVYAPRNIRIALRSADS